MRHEIEFNWFKIEIDSVAFSILGKDIYWYGIIIVIGFILGVQYILRYCSEYNISRDSVMDCVGICAPLAVVCARIYYVIFEWGYYSKNKLEIFNIRGGGLAIYGGILGVILGLYVYTKVKGYNIMDYTDIAVQGILIGQFIGRWGNFINCEAYGKETTLPWGMSIDGGVPVHPTFLYESIWNLAGLMVIRKYTKKRKFSGELTAIYFIWYGVGRSLIEGVRADSLYVGQFRISQVVAIMTMVIGIIYVVYRRNREV